METHQPNDETKSSSSAFICRPSSTRWTPTPEQIRILKDLYYNNGVRSPTAEQIQKISSRLRQYGKIEGKNVFYWFQNHKARERQKKRLLTTSNNTNTDLNSQTSSHCLLKPQDYLLKAPSSSSGGHGVYTNGQMGNNNNFGSTYASSVSMEKNFRDCSINGNGHNFGWMGIEPYALFGNKICQIEEVDGEEEEEEDEHDANDIETLPLFPMHGEDHFDPFYNLKRDPNTYYYGSEDGHGGSRASLELSLNSYTTWSSGPM